VKYEPTAFKGLFTLAAFNIARQNVLTPDPLHPLFSVQTGEVVSKGIEAEGKVSLTDSLDLVAAYTLLNVKVTKSNGPDLGKWPVGIPEHAAALWADYTFRYGALWGFGMAAGVRFVGPTWADTINTVQVPSYTLVDAAIHYDLAGLGPAFKGYKLAVNATNLFDQTYVSSCLAAPNQCFYGLRRTVLATVRYQW
jgi:iron complex outermembrane receptor protein